ncbi:MATE family efflux transporter [Streptomyces sp. NPDC093510]|uniref:MATE family efflux transporter n=1 Tax=Streptomyces sp. NPDC093510 TaxID=3155199 RepID=UPI00343614F8
MRNYAGLATTIGLIGLASVGFGAIDLLMIAPKGIDQVAAVGLGDVITAGISALFVIGIVDTFSGRLAIAEGSGSIARRLPALAGALLLLVIPVQIVASLIILGVEPALRLAGQSADVVPLTGDFVTVRGLSIGFSVVYAALNEALKICGLKNKSLMLLVLGFGANAALNWLFLYTGAAELFASPAAAVAAATTAAQLLIACGSLWLFLRALRERADSFAKLSWSTSAAEARSMARTAPGVGVRHFNDYSGTIARTMLLGTLGVRTLAAVTVAVKIWSLFCRIPQACVSSTFVFYGYRLGEGEPDLSRTSRLLLRYAAVPTAAGAVLVAVFSPWLVAAFADGQQDTELTRSLVLACLLTVPAYLLEHHFGEILTVHQRGGLLALASTVTNYALAIPLAAVAVFVWDSAVLAVAGALIPSAVLALVFWRAVRNGCWTRAEVSNADAANPGVRA